MKRLLVVVLAISATSALGATPPGDDRAIAHLLNRIAFGPRPGDVDRVRAIGIDRYIDEQLHPDRVGDDGVRARLADLEMPRLRRREIVESIELPQIEERRERKQGANGGAGERQPPNPPQQRANAIVVELAEQKIVRAVYSERQLQEVLADFWFNHFNVDSRKGRDRFLVSEHERDVIRPRVLGSFRDLLGATAKSPAMLFYLDNWMSADPAFARATNARASARQGRSRFGAPGRPALQPQGNRAKKGLNENYARELMELHTLGVDGGYTQKDVTEVARAFTGWTLENPRRGGGFTFDARLHDPGQKVVLGHVIKAGGGQSDGEAVLDILATHPSTARFIATKLARRFVSDTPPPALVDRAAARFREAGGNLREVMRTILTSPEFRSVDVFAAKVKSPFEFVVSALRATGTEVIAGGAAALRQAQGRPEQGRGAAPAFDAKLLVRRIRDMGMPLYQCQPPTGYGDTADAWVNSGALVDRINFALELARNDRQLADALGAPGFQRR